DRAVRRNDAREIELRDDLDDAAAADPRHAGLGDGLGEAGLIGPAVDADDPAARLQRVAVDADPLDGARRGPLAAGDLRALKGWPGRAGRGKETSRIPEDDLRVRADVDEQVDALAFRLRFLGEDHPGGVRTDVAGDARQYVHARARVRPDPKF